MFKNLSPRTAQIVRALIEVLKPRKPGFDPPIDEEILKVADNFIGHLPSHMKFLLPLGLYLLEFGTLIFVPTFRRFSRMPLEEREKYILSWTESKIALRRDLIKGIKAICMTGFYAHPAIMQSIGYELEEHLKKINVSEEPTVPCNQEAYEYFKKLEETGTWGPTVGEPGRVKEKTE